MASIHAHEIMQMMIDSNEPFSRESLKETISSKFGADAIFHSCSQQDMTVETVVDFLEAKNKFVPTGGGFSTDSSKMCSH